jgi:uncharacterized OB-fold protein
MTETNVLPPMPVVTPLTEFFWEGANQHRLMILRCQSCGHFVHYPRPMCERCLSETLAPEQVSGRGTLYSYTITNKAFHPYWVDRLPYVLASVELEEQVGLKMPSNVINCEHDRLAVGMPLEVAFHEVAPGLTLPFFRPREGQ